MHRSWPLTLWVDDVHWADEDGVRLMREVIDLLESDGPSLILSGRELPSGLSELCGIEIQLGPLNEEQARELGYRPGEQIRHPAGRGHRRLSVRLVGQRQSGSHLLLYQISVYRRFGLMLDSG